MRRESEVEALLERATAWASRRRDVVALGLVGSWARGAARLDSDVDLVLLTTDPPLYTDVDDWIGELGAPDVARRADWGALVERRLRLPSGLEVEVGIGAPTWASTDPVDEGTRAVVEDGLRALYDPDSLLDMLLLKSIADRR